MYISQNHRELCASHSPRRILNCANTLCQYDKKIIVITIINDNISFRPIVRWVEFSPMARETGS